MDARTRAGLATEPVPGPSSDLRSLEEDSHSPRPGTADLGTKPVAVGTPCLGTQSNVSTRIGLPGIGKPLP